jgi:hypothetical protein
MLLLGSSGEAKAQIGFEYTLSKLAQPQVAYGQVNVTVWSKRQKKKLV